MMKNKLLLIFIGITVLAVAGFLVFKQTNISGEPTSFNLIFKYGVGAKNELNTFNQTYTKDMVMAPPVTIKFKLPDSEMAGLRQKIEDLKLFDKNEKPAEGDISMMKIPCSSYYLKAQINSVQKELSWDDCQGKISDKLKQFMEYIIPIIEAKDEYKKLPEREGSYM